MFVFSGFARRRHVVAVVVVDRTYGVPAVEEESRYSSERIQRVED
jgi:hypothetical protein